MDELQEIKDKTSKNSHQIIRRRMKKMISGLGQATTLIPEN